MTDRLDSPRRCREELEALLREHVPDAEVWAYGRSRVNGRCHSGSDLNLVLRSPSLEPEVPPDLDVHLIVDNYATHKTALIRNWLAKGMVDYAKA